MSDPDILIIGAGAAGLAAAVDLAHAGIRTQILEARDRIGGRMFTQIDPGTQYPVELGAEFIHGIAPEIWQPLQSHRVKVREVSGDFWCVRDHQICPCDFFSDAENILDKMDDTGPDESFTQFVDRRFPSSERDPKLQKAIDRAQNYIVGFNAADPDLVGLHWLVQSMRAEEPIEGDRAFRMEGGYHTLTEVFRKKLEAANVPIELNANVQEINWGKGKVTVQTGTRTYSAKRALITLPLGVLQANKIRFEPELPPAKQHALHGLVMGKIVRVTLSFRERFWESIRVQSKTLNHMSFLFSDDPWFPTWWTQMPAKVPIITAWAPADRAERISSEGPEFAAHQSLESLGSLLHVSTRDLESLLQVAYVHDWQNDPFSVGAYSYGRVGGDGAQEALGRPVDDTLFFAGEATDVTGYNGTVHGAIASAHRAVHQLRLSS